MILKRSKIFLLFIIVLMIFVFNLSREAYSRAGSSNSRSYRSSRTYNTYRPRSYSSSSRRTRAYNRNRYRNYNYSTKRYNRKVYKTYKPYKYSRRRRRTRTYRYPSSSKYKYHNRKIYYPPVKYKGRTRRKYRSYRSYRSRRRKNQQGCCCCFSIIIAFFVIIGIFGSNVQNKGVTNDAGVQGSGGSLFTTSPQNPIQNKSVFPTKPQQDVVNKNLVRSQIESLKKKHPDFVEREFIDKSRSSFYEVYNSLSKSDLEPVRDLISDREYHRMDRHIKDTLDKGQRDVIENVNVNNLVISESGINSSGKDFIKVEFDSSMVNKTLDSFGNLVKGDEQLKHHKESWTFILQEKKYKKGEDMGSCPLCTAPYDEDTKDKCPFCNTPVPPPPSVWVLDLIEKK